MKHTRIIGSLIVLALVALGATAFLNRNSRPRDPAPVPTATPALRVIDVAASNYAFDAPDSVPAGAVTFRLTNHGPELHHLVIVPLPEGKTVSDLMAESEGEHTPAWARPVGGPNAVDPGSHNETSVELTPGRYAMVCIIPAPDGMMHLKKGMAHEFTVTPQGAASGLPAGEVSMRLVDFGFTLSGPMTAGRHLLSVQNDATQPHEVVIFKLAPGKHLPDFLAWFQNPVGPPPASAIGGASPLAPGARNVVTLDLTPGTYGIICFLPDHGDGKPHFAHGMMQEFTI